MQTVLGVSSRHCDEALLRTQRRTSRAYEFMKQLLTCRLYATSLVTAQIYKMLKIFRVKNSIFGRTLFVFRQKTHLTVLFVLISAFYTLTLFIDEVSPRLWKYTDYECLYPVDGS